MADNIVYLNDDNFTQTTASGVTLVDFYADWCGPCRMMEPVLHQLADEMKGRAKIAKLDIESAQSTTANFDVTSIPTLIIFKDGKEMNRIVGVRDLDSLKGTLTSFL
jgi:thioredoxin 1